MKHTHKYMRRAIYDGKYKVWACGFSNCSHYMPVHTGDNLMEGKRSICNMCGNPFTLTYTNMQTDTPTCSQKCEEEIMQVTELDSVLNERIDDMVNPLTRAFQKKPRTKRELEESMGNEYKKITPEGDIIEIFEPTENQESTPEEPKKSGLTDEQREKAREFLKDVKFGK